MNIITLAKTILFIAMLALASCGSEEPGSGLETTELENQSTYPAGYQADFNDSCADFVLESYPDLLVDDVLYYCQCRYEHISKNYTYEQWNENFVFINEKMLEDGVTRQCLVTAEIWDQVKAAEAEKATEDSEEGASQLESGGESETPDDTTETRDETKLIRGDSKEKVLEALGEPDTIAVTEYILDYGSGDFTEWMYKSEDVCADIYEHLDEYCYFYFEDGELVHTTGVNTDLLDPLNY